MEIYRRHHAIAVAARGDAFAPLRVVVGLAWGDAVYGDLGSEERRDFTALGTRLVPGTALPVPIGVFPRYEAP